MHCAAAAVVLVGRLVGAAAVALPVQTVHLEAAVVVLTAVHLEADVVVVVVSLVQVVPPVWWVRLPCVYAAASLLVQG